MPDVKISELPAAAAVADAMQFEVNDAGTSRRVTAAQVKEHVAGATNGVLARTGAGVVTARTITGTAPVTVANGNGVSGNPTIGVTLATVTEAEDGTGTGLMNATLTAAAIAAQAGGGGGGGGAWAPYNGTDGIFWSFAVNGVSAAIQTPDFENGYEYLVELRRVTPNRESARTINHQMNMTVEFQGVGTLSRPVVLIPAGSSGTEREVGSQGNTVIEYGPPVPAGTPYDALVETLSPRLLRHVHTLRRHYFVRGTIALSADPVALNEGLWAVGNGATTSRIRRLRFTFAGATTQFNGGEARLYRRGQTLLNP